MKAFKLAMILWLCLFSYIDNLAAQISFTLDHSLLDQLALPSDGQSRRSSSTDPNIDGNGDSRLIQPGETLVLADMEGPVVINRRDFLEYKSCVFYGFNVPNLKGDAHTMIERPPQSKLICFMKSRTGQTRRSIGCHNYGRATTEFRFLST